MKIVKKINNRGILLLLLATGMIVTFTSCEKEPEAIKLPPDESLVINWDMFPSQAVRKASEGVEQPTPTHVNWLYSAGSVVVWNTVIAANMAIPTVAYRAALNNDPVYLGDDIWEWSYSVSINSRTIEAQLTGSRIDKEQFFLEMRLSEHNGFQDFKWFEGVVSSDHSYANWTLYHSPEKPDEYLEIVYNKNFDTEVSNITYTVIDPLNDLYNGSIDFGIDPGQDFDAHYTIFMNNNTTSIEWSMETQAGRVKDESRFSDAEWHCWDTLLQDVNCTEGSIPSLSGKD